VAADPYLDTRRHQLIMFAAQNRLSTIYQFREFAVDRGLISYGPSITDSYRQGGNYVGQILKGAKPSDLPVLQPTKFELVINLKTAKALGLAIPPGLISFADEVIDLWSVLHRQRSPIRSRIRVVPNGESSVAMPIIRECRMRAAILTSIAKDAPELEIQLLYVAKEYLTLAIISEQFNAETPRTSCNVRI